MSYESRLYVVRENYRFTRNCKDGRTRGFGSVLAMMNLSGCAGLEDIFTEEAGCCIYENTKPIYKDCYGDIIASASVETVITELERLVEVYDHRRAKFALALLRELQNSISAKEWDDDVIRVYHYGY